MRCAGQTFCHDGFVVERPIAPAGSAAADAVCVDRSPRPQRRLASRFSRFAARFSSNVLAAFFLFSFFRSMPLLMGSPLHRSVCEIAYGNIPRRQYSGLDRPPVARQAVS